jgi:LuxR family maltose regulon positive regulatory protein
LVAEYLIEEVIDRLTAVDRQFLLQTSVADRISGPLADELTGRGDGQVVLERLMIQNTLLVGLGANNEWFIVHPMLRAVLAHRLAIEQPGAVRELHLRSSRWFALHDEPIHAVRHAVAAEDWDEVGRLLTGIAWPELLTANASALASALQPAADRSRMNPTVGTLLAAAVRDLHRQDFDSMIRAVNFAADKLIETPNEDRYPAEALVALLRIAHSHIRNPALTGSAAAALLQILDREPRLHLPTSGQHRVFAGNNVAIGQLWNGDLSAAERALAAVHVRCHDLGLGLTELSAHAHLALLDVIHGRLPAARRRAVMAQDVADRRSWTGEPDALGIFAALALTHLEQGRFDMAASTVDGRLTVSRTGSEAACRIVLGIAAVGVAVARRDPVAALAASTQLGTIQSEAGDLPTMLSRWCAVAHADAHLATGSPERALAALGEIGVVPGYTYFLERIVLAKVQLMMDQPDTALDLLDPVPAAASSYRGVVVEALILTAVAAERMHRFTAALTALTEAIDLAQDAGIYRPFLGADPLIEGLLARHRHLVARHLEFTRTLSASFAGETPTASASSAAGESLTERELAVLSYLPTMLNSAEIAADLFVTANTVKSHQQSIYRKLGVNTRRNAVDKARILNLI